MNRAYIAKSNAERERLKTLIEQLSDADLSRPMPAGWTVAGVLAHMAFWDARALALINKWESGIAPSKADAEPEAVDWINDAAKPLCLALPPRTAAQLAVQLAEETDHRVAILSDELVTQITALETVLNLSRAEHRQEHLNEIEHSLGR